MEQIQLENEGIRKPPKTLHRKRKKPRKFPQLPHELIEEILQKLPVRFLLRFKSISKQWRSTIESRDFVERHLLHQKSRDPKIIIFSSFQGSLRDQLTSLSVESISVEENGEICRSYTLSIPVGIPFEISESCDGLICICRNMSIYVFNPETRERRQLPDGSPDRRSLCPKPDDHARSHDWRIIYSSAGICRDRLTKTYKVIRIHKLVDMFFGVRTECEVFSFKANTWRHVSQVPYIINVKQKPVYAYESLHWFVKDDHEDYQNAKILAFNIHDEKFHIVPNPFVDSTPETFYGILSRKMYSLRNRLCMTDFADLRLNIWSMDPNEKWEKTYSINIYNTIGSVKNYHIFTPLVMCDDGRIVIRDSDNLFTYNSERENLHLVSKKRGVTVAYFESLVSPYQ